MSFVFDFSFPPPPGAIIREPPWANAFPRGTGLLVQQTGIGRGKVAIKVIPRGESSGSKSLPLEEWPATTGERLGFETSMLNKQLLGLSFVADDIKACLEGSKEMKPEWKKQIDQISEALATLSGLTDGLVSSIGGALLDGELSRSTPAAEEQDRAQDPSLLTQAS